MLVLGPLEDQISFLVLAKIPFASIAKFPYAYILKTFVDPFSSSEPFTFLVAILLKFLFGINYLTVFIGITLLLNTVVSYLFFKRFKFGFLYSLIFSFSSYLWLHLGTHMSLSQLWLYPLFLIILFYSHSYKGSIVKIVLLMSSFLAFSVFVSNYIGFFILLYFCLDSIWQFGVSYFEHKKLNFKYLGFVLATLIISGLSIFVMKNNFVESRQLVNLPSPYRTIEDFFYFSTRPWYPLIPSPKHLVYGDFSMGILSSIASSGNFLTDDYFIGEHGAAFFGYFLSLTFLVVSLYILYKGIMEQKLPLLKYWFINICLFLLMLPPYFTLSGFTFYTPGYLVYLIFPMFRTLIRMSVLIQFNILIVIGMFFSDFSKNHPQKKFAITLFVFLLAILTIFETFIPLKIRNMDTSPEVYSYMGANYQASKFVVYPYDKTNEAIFWIDAHKSYLLNPRMYNKDGFDSESFTTGLNTVAGLSEITNALLDADYLVVFKGINDADVSLFLSSTDFLILEKEFSDAYLFRIVSAND